MFIFVPSCHGELLINIDSNSSGDSYVFVIVSENGCFFSRGYCVGLVLNR